MVTVYYTSGTTGAPKGCMLHHGWWLRVIDIDLRLFRRGWQDRQLCCLPFYYADPAIQLISIDPRIFDGYSRNPDFIQAYIFPGGMLIDEPRFERLTRERRLPREFARRRAGRPTSHG